MLNKYPLGHTGLKVSPLGLGTVKFGRNTGVKYPSAFELPDDRTILSLLDCCEELGINLLDTAPAYGVSEERLGKLLAGRRLQFVISTKVGETFADGRSSFDFSPIATKRSIEQSLRRLDTDFLDIVLVHSNGEDEKIIRETDILATLQLLKESGIIRAYGLSGKSTAGGLLALPLSDLVMVTYNPSATEEQPVIAEAHRQGRGVLIKKALSSGHLPSDCSHGDAVQTAMQFIFSQPGISSVVTGTLSEQHLRHNAAAAAGAMESTI